MKTLIALIVFSVCLFPFVKMLGRIVPQPELFRLLFEKQVVDSLILSLKVAFLSLVLALALGAPASYLITRTNISGKSFLRFWILFPFFIPSYLFAIAWVVLALPRVGVLNRLAGMEWISIYSLGGLVWVTCNAFFPLIITTFSKAFSQMDPSLEESARISGASPLKVFFKITLPCHIPTLIGASTIFILVALSSFGIPAIIGNPAKLYVLTTQIYTLAKMGGVGGADQGFVISLWLIGFAGLFTGLGRFFSQRTQVSLIVGKASRTSEIHLGRWKIPAQLFLYSLLFVFIVIPMGALFLNSFLQVPGDFKWSNLTLSNYRYLISLQETTTAIGNSLSLALLGSFICCLLGFFLVAFEFRFLEKLASLPFSIPGTIIALSFIVALGKWTDPVFLMLFAYVAKDLAIAIQNLGPSIGMIDKSILEAGRIYGASPLKVLDRILFPLVSPAMAGVFLLCFLPMLSELTMSVLLYGPGSETVGTLIFQLQDYANPLAACALATVLVLVLGSGMFLVPRLTKENL